MFMNSHKPLGNPEGPSRAEQKGSGRKPHSLVSGRYHLPTSPGRERVVQVSRYWESWALGWLLLAFLGVLLIISMVRFGEFASGPAVIRIANRLQVVAPVSGVVESIDVRPAEAVRAGQPGGRPRPNVHDLEGVSTTRKLRSSFC